MNKKLAISAEPLQSIFAESEEPISRRQRLSVTLLTSDAEFAALAVEWNRLHGLAHVASVFTSWLWQYNWWKHYGEGRPLRILVCREVDEPVGILALYVQRIEVFGIGVNVLRLVGTEGDTHPDDLGPVLAPGSDRAAALALARAALRLPLVDVVLVSDIDPRSPFPQAVERAAGEERLPGAKGASERIAYLELPATWEAFLAALNSRRRSCIRNARRKLQEVFPDARFFVWQDPNRLDDAVDRLAELHRRRWLAAGSGSESFATRAYMEFHRGVIRSFLMRGWLRLYCLEVRGELAAITYCYRFRNRVFLMQAGFDPALAPLKPGGVLLGHALEHAIGEGNEVFDFLRGEHRYKDELATGRRETRFVQVFRRTPAAMAYRLRFRHLPRLKARLRGISKEGGRALRSPFTRWLPLG